MEKAVSQSYTQQPDTARCTAAQEFRAHFFNIHSHSTLSSRLQRGVPTCFLHSILSATALSHMCHPPNIFYIPQFNSVAKNSCGCSLCSFLRHLLTFSTVGPDILLFTVFSKKLSVCFSSDVKDHGFLPT